MKKSSGKKRGIGEPGRDRHHVSAEDQRFYRARRKVVALCNVVGAEKSYYCSRCDDTYFYNSTLNPTAVLERHQRRFDCREFFRRRQAEALGTPYVPKRPALDRRDTVICIDGVRTGDGYYEVDDHGFDATEWDDIDDRDAELGQNREDDSYERSRDKDLFLVGSLPSSEDPSSSSSSASSLVRGGSFNAVLLQKLLLHGTKESLEYAIAHPVPQSTIIDVQKEMLDRYAADHASDIRSHSTDDGDTKCFEDIVQLYGWGLKHTISQEAGDSLLQVLYDIMQRHQKVIPLGLTWVALKKALRRRSRGLFKPRHFSYSLHKKFFGTRLANGSPLKPVLAYGMDLIHVIAKSLLDVNPERFITEYVPPVLVDYEGIDCTHNGFMSDFSSSNRMKVMHEDAEKYGLIEGKKPFHVGLNIFTDKSQITTTTSEQPVVFSIMNSRDSDYKMIFAGYAPLKLGHSDAVLEELLSSLGFVAKKTIKSILDWQKRQNSLNLIVDLFKEVTELGRNCFRVQIGRGEKAFEAVVFINVCHLGGDNEQSDYTCGCHNASKLRNCRCCVSNR